jgi:lipopolysaccharide transport system permease protein
MDFDSSESARPLEPISTRVPEPAASSALPALPHVVIESEGSGVQLNLSDLWAYRELLYFLTLRDIKVRYKQTLMGAVWVIIQPLMTMLIFTLIFNKFVRLDTKDIPYPLFAYSGLLLWTFFSNSIISGTYSLVNNAQLVTKVYFPRVFVPAASVGAGLVDLVIASLLLIALALYYGVNPSWRIAVLPLFVLIAAMLALGAGMLVSALTVKYRDLRHALPFIMQFWMFASPVIYPTSIVPEGWRWVLVINPMSGVLEGFRAALTGHSLDWTPVTVAAAMATALLAVAYYIFRGLEDTFADVI